MFASAIVILAMFWITWAVVGGVFVAAETSAMVACPSGVGFVVTDAALRSVDTGVCPGRDVLMVVVTAEMVNN